MLIDKGLLNVGDDILFRNGSTDLYCSVTSNGGILFTDPNTNISETFYYMKPLVSHIQAVIKDSKHLKVWNVLYRVTKERGRNKLTRLKDIRSQYVAMMKGDKGSQPSSITSTSTTSEPTRKKRKKAETTPTKTKGLRVTVSDLVRAGYLKEGDEVYYKDSVKQIVHPAVIHNRSIRVTDPTTNKHTYVETVNAFKAHLKEVGNSWHFTYLKSKEGKHVPFQNLRDLYFTNAHHEDTGN